MESSRVSSFITILMIGLAIGLGGLLLSNQDGVNRRHAELERTEGDLIRLSEEVYSLAKTDKSPQERLMEVERLARERLQWTRPGEYIIRIEAE